MLADATVAELAVACAVIFAGSLLQGAVGFGVALVAAPVLVLIDPHLVPGPMSVVGLGLCILVAWRDRAAIDFGGIGWCLAGRVPGAVAGGLVLALADADTLAWLVAASVLVGVALSVRAPHWEPTRPALLAAGALSGLMGTATSIGGPPMALIFQHAEGVRLRANLAAFFVAGSVLSLAAIRAAGHLGADELSWSALLLVPTAAGFAVSGRATAWLDAGRTRPAVLAVCVASAVVLAASRLW
jgi:uncharacterized membrane protein YfcA